MGLLADARRLAASDGASEDGLCIFCGALPYWPLEEERDEVPHDPGCPWLAVPRILAVLGAAERLVAGDVPGEVRATYTDQPYWQALVAALKGDEVTA